MVIRTSRPGLATLLFFACILWFIPPVSAQAAEPAVQVVLPSKGVVQGQKFVVYLRVDDHGSEQALVFMPNSGTGLKTIAGPEIFRGRDLPADQAPDRAEAAPTGRAEKDYLFVRYVFMASESGYRHFPPVSIRVGSRNYLSTEVLIPVASSKKKDWVPPRLEWSLPQGAVYEGQAVLVKLNLRYLDTLILPPEPDLPPVTGGIIEAVKEPGSIEKETIAGHDFHRMPVAAYMLTPSSRGTLRLPEVRMTINEETLAAEAVTMEVKTLPEDLGHSGAVGNFAFNSWVEPLTVQVDGQFSVHLQVQGTGNLQFLQVPRPDFSALTVLDSSEVLDAKPGLEGYQGTRTLTFRLAAPRPGEYSFTVPPFRYFDPALTVQEIPPRVLQFHVVPKDPKVNDVAGNESDTFSTPERMILLAPVIHQGHWFWLLLILCTGMVVYGAVYRLLKGRQPPFRSVVACIVVAGGILLVAFVSGAFGSTMTPEDQARIVSMDTHARAGQYAEAVRVGSDVALRNPGQADLMFNLARYSELAGKQARSLFWLTEAGRTSPWRRDIQQLRIQAEKAAGLDRQLRIIEYPPQYLVFLAGVGCLFVTGLLLCLFPYRRRAVFHTLIFVLALAGVVLLVLNGFASAQAHDPRVIITEEGASLRKIPDLEATEWLPLAPGTSLERAGMAGDFILVETAFGIQGWIPADRMYAGPLGQP